MGRVAAVAPGGTGGRTVSTTRRERTGAVYADAGGFVLRSPLLPFETLVAVGSGTARVAWESGADLEASLAADATDLATRLRDLLAADPVVREAIFVASPSLDERIERWLADDGRTDEDEAGLVRSVLSYLSRMSARATPFGLFAGCSYGVIGPGSALTLGARETGARQTRIDFSFLTKLAADIAANPPAVAQFTLYPNTSLYRAGGRLRMVEARIGERVRYHRATFDEDEALLATIERASGGARLDDLAAPLTDEDVTLDDAREYVAELVAAQILQPALGPVIAGERPVADMVARLAGHPAGVTAAEVLADADDKLVALDRDGLGSPPARYREIADALRKADASLRVDRLFQVDLAKPAPDLAMGRAVVAEVYRAVDLLTLLARDPHGEDDMSRFRDAFRDRYEGREVPVLEAIDEEVGVGYGPPPSITAEGAPLLAGLVPAGPAGGVGGPRFTKVDDYLLSLLTDALETGATEIEVHEPDLAQFERTSRTRLPLPDAFAANITVVSPSAEVAAQGTFRVLFGGASGPSGAQMLGRFCHLDAQITDLVAANLVAEERARPDVVYAEVVHLPEGRVGNILARPVLRQYEIPFLACSGVKADNQLPPDDLLVSVIGDRVVLRSRRLDREVRPRITNAHNHQTGALPFYRFLGALQSSGTLGHIQWSWGALRSAKYLPRVVSGRLVLSRASWHVSRAELKYVLSAKTAADRFRAVQEIREVRRLPRWVVVAAGDNELPIDLDTVGGAEMLAHEAKRVAVLALVELFPGPDDLCVTSPDGRFCHEAVIPFARREPVAAQPIRPPVGGGVRSIFPPGSEWLTVKLYGGKAAADAVLRDVVAPVVAATTPDRWFFLRYIDPEPHLRLRFAGERGHLLDTVLPRLTDLVDPWLGDGRVWRMQLDTYRREVDRYGGPEGVLFAEEVFCADSEAALAMLFATDGEQTLDLRWRLALVGIDRLLADLGLDLPVRQAMVRHLRDGAPTAHGAGEEYARRWAGKLLRRERVTLEGLLAGETPSAPLTAGLAALDQRSARQAPSLAGLRDLSVAGRLSRPVSDIAVSFVHMHANRMLRAVQPQQEVVIYDLLDRLYHARLGRERGAR
jgi:thiopeptide-type bacteriocin biosynthesis protein